VFEQMMLTSTDSVQKKQLFELVELRYKIFGGNARRIFNFINTTAMPTMLTIPDDVKNSLLVPTLQDLQIGRIDVLSWHSLGDKLITTKESLDWILEKDPRGPTCQ